VVVIGFLVVLLASSGLEAMRFYSMKASLPLEPGGVIGLELGNAGAFSTWASPAEPCCFWH
jgi:S-DNA-T family DNA segregation ATPase FtsK/SpoIIIE